jgi:hypothetical protein
MTLDRMQRFSWLLTPPPPPCNWCDTGQDAKDNKPSEPPAASTRAYGSSTPQFSFHAPPGGAAPPAVAASSGWGTVLLFLIDGVDMRVIQRHFSWFCAVHGPLLVPLLASWFCAVHGPLLVPLLASWFCAVHGPLLVPLLASWFCLDPSSCHPELLSRNTDSIGSLLNLNRATNKGCNHELCRLPTTCHATLKASDRC